MKEKSTETLILEAAEREFLTKGFAGARTTVIAEDAGVTHAMLHYYFRSKQNLFDRIVESKLELLDRLVFSAFDDESFPLAERLSRVIAAHFDFIADNPGLPTFMITQLNADSSLRLKIVAAVGNMVNRLSTSLQRQIDAEAARGLCERIDARMLLFDMASLNVFIFLAAPIVDPMISGMFGDRKAFLEARKQENITTILKRLKP